MERQPDLPIRTEAPLFTIKAGHPNIDWLIETLHGAGAWQTAAEICVKAGKLGTDQNKRWVRALADASGGRVAGGQRGYKLVVQMTGEEYQHWRNWMNHQANEMKRRVIEADRVFYARKPVEISTLKPEISDAATPATTATQHQHLDLDFAI